MGGKIELVTHWSGDHILLHCALWGAQEVAGGKDAEKENDERPQ